MDRWGCHGSSEHACPRFVIALIVLDMRAFEFVSEQEDQV